MNTLHAFRILLCGSCGQSLKVPISCKNRFCHICSGPRKRRIRSRIASIVGSLELKNGYSTKMVTLTMSDQDDLAVAVKILISSFRKLRQRKFWKRKVKGGAFVIEVTGYPGKWHAHLHCIVEAKFIPSFTLSAEWSQVAPGKIVDVCWLPPSSIIKYITKYLTKSGADESHDLEVSAALKGTRLFQPFGSWQALSTIPVKEKYHCSCCGYTGFYLQDTPVVWMEYGRAPPSGSEDRKRWNKMVTVHGLPTHPKFGDIYPNASDSNVAFVAERDRNVSIGHDWILGKPEL